MSKALKYYSELSKIATSMPKQKAKKPTQANPASRFNIISGKIEKYRTGKEEAAKKAEKDSATKMKELQKQQQEMAGRLSPADQMRENFNNFAGMDFSGGNPAANPTVKAITPVQNGGAPQPSKVASIRAKIASFKKKADIGEPSEYQYTDTPAIRDFALDPKNTDAARIAAQREILKDPKYKVHPIASLLIRYGVPLMQALGLGRTDNKLQQGNLVNIQANPRNRLGELISYDNSNKLYRKIPGW